MPSTAFFAIFFEMVTPVMPLAWRKIPLAASIEVPSTPPRPTPLLARPGLSPSSVKPLKDTLPVLMVTTAPEEVFVAAGTTIASATRDPPFGETSQFGPRTSSALPIVTFSAYVPAATITVSPAAAAFTAAWMVFFGQLIVPRSASSPVASLTYQVPLFVVMTVTVKVSV